MIQPVVWRVCFKIKRLLYQVETTCKINYKSGFSVQGKKYTEELY
jgi:hypothetical protein